MDATLKTNNKIVRICSAIAVGLAGLLFLLLSLASILQTCRIDQANPYAEIIRFDNDLVLTNLALIFLTILGTLFFLRKNIKISAVSTRFIVLIMLMVTTIISLAWVNLVQSKSSGDTMILLNTARDAANNQYNSFHASYSYYGNYSYYLYWPSRLGYVLFAEILYRIFGTASSDILFQVPNVIALNCIYVGIVMLTKRLFDRKSVTNLTAIFLTVCFQPMFMTTFTYGILPGLAFFVWSAYHAVRFMQTDKWTHGLAAVALIAGSVLFEADNMVMAAAIVIALLMHAVDKMKLKNSLISLGLAALMILCPIGLQKSVIASYAGRSGSVLNTHITLKMYAYMGISDCNMAPGWYNGLAMEVLRDNNMDVKKADEAASEGIKNRLDYLSKNNLLFDFEKKKLLSQLNEPAFESIWLSQVREHDLAQGEQLPPIATSVYSGGLAKVLDNWFNYYNMIVYLAFTAGMAFLILRKKLKPWMVILPVTVLGGVLYHMLFEGKSQYLLPYFLLLIPFAVYGLIEGVKAINKKVDRLYR